MRKEYPYLKIIISYPLYHGKEGDYIYSNEEKYSETIKQLSRYLNTTNNSAPDFLEPKLSPTGVIMLLGVPTQLQQSNESGV